VEAGLEESADLRVVENALLTFLGAGAFACVQAAEGVVVDQAAAEGEREDPAERNERTVDRFRGEALRAEFVD
jgi:hypothetical protein